MRIHGAVALALPEADARTVWLTMTPLERRLFDEAVAHAAFKLRIATHRGLIRFLITLHLDNLFWYHLVI